MNTNDDIFQGVGIEVTFDSPECFLKIKETLTRIGIASKKDEKTLFQSCHILHKRGRYRILSFKELFILDGKQSTLTEEDIGRRNTIVNLLVEWNLVKVADPQQSAAPVSPLNQIKIVSFKEKPEWNLVPKYTIGSKKV